MKTILQLVVATATAMAINAQVIPSESEFNLSGPAGNGLYGGNEVLPNSSPASGREITDSFFPRGIYYNGTELEVHIGWGDNVAIGGTDLTGDFTASHIHGPADTTENAGVLYTLATAASPSGVLTSDGPGARSAFIDINVPLVDLDTYTVEQQVQDLFAGLWYINVHSTAYPGGEIRGQLVPIPEPQTYAAIAGVALLGFGGYRRFKLKQAPAA